MTTSQPTTRRSRINHQRLAAWITVLVFCAITWAAIVTAVAYAIRSLA